MGSMEWRHYSLSVNGLTWQEGDRAVAIEDCPAEELL